MNLPLVISFYTKDTIYEKEIEDLAASCQALKIEHYIEARKDLGSWNQNCCQKPQFILECLQKFNRPLLWVDADAIILQKPTLHFQEIDIALYFNDLPTHNARNGTIYIAPTNDAFHFMSTWHEACQRKLIEHPTCADQNVMNELLQGASLQIGHLPIEYSVVFDRDPIPFYQAVILHFQASRTALMHESFWKHLSGSQLKTHRMTSIAAHMAEIRAKTEQSTEA